MKTLFIGIVAFFMCTVQSDNLQPDKAEAQAAYNYINKIRQNPAAFSQAIGVDLSNIKTMPALVWNDTLAKVAEAKALDMATRNYFAHVDPDGYAINYYINKAGYKLNPSWLNDKKNNYFESIQAGESSGEDAVRSLIQDRTTPSLGHRKHLLGMEKFNSTLVDIGIGFVKVPDGKANYITYTSIVIAKHDW
ncbi:CAP domain-containing protein [Chitinophagaceae bacterium LWZ2-11]